MANSKNGKKPGISNGQRGIASKFKKFSYLLLPKRDVLPVERKRENSILQVEGGQPSSLEADPGAMQEWELCWVLGGVTVRVDIVGGGVTSLSLCAPNSLARGENELLEQAGSQLPSLFNENSSYC